MANTTTLLPIKSEVLIEIGKILRYDIRSVFPRLKKLPEAGDLNYFNSDPTEFFHKVEELEGVYLTSKQAAAETAQEAKFLKEQIENRRVSKKTIATKSSPLFPDCLFLFASESFSSV